MSTMSFKGSLGKEHLEKPDWHGDERLGDSSSYTALQHYILIYMAYAYCATVSQIFCRAY